MRDTAAADSTRVTIGDVAERAGVSIATVSRVVNERYGVRRATIARVQEVIDELGYESSLVARSLRSQRTNVIGILVADIEPFSAELLKGAARALAGHRLRARRLLRRHARRRGLGAALPVAPERHAHRRHDPRRPDRRRGRARPPDRRRRPARRRLAPADRRLPELRRWRAGDPSTSSSSATAGSASSPAAPISSRPADARTATATRWPRPASRSIPTLVQVGGFTEETAEAPAQRAAHARPIGRRRSSPPTTCRRSRSCAPPPSSACGSPTTCRSSASTTSPSRRSPTRR